MAAKHNRTVTRRTNGQWANQRNEASRAASLHPTQAEAIAAARRLLEKNGGGELTIMGEDGRIRSKDTIPPARDPNPPKDREH